MDGFFECFHEFNRIAVYYPPSYSPCKMKFYLKKLLYKRKKSPVLP